MPEFKMRTNRYGQQVSVEMQEKRYQEVLQDLDKRYGEGETYEIHEYDYKQEGKGKTKRYVKYVVQTHVENKCDRAKWHAENDY